MVLRRRRGLEAFQYDEKERCEEPGVKGSGGQELVVRFWSMHVRFFVFSAAGQCILPRGGATLPDCSIVDFLAVVYSIILYMNHHICDADSQSSTCWALH
jgi:hypothetical protein